jgi:hypothetical protein
MAGPSRGGRRNRIAMTKAGWAAGLALSVLAGDAGAGPPSNAIAPTPQAQAMQRMLADINTLRGYAYGGGDHAGALAAANDLLAWSQRMGELFPPGKASEDYVDMSPERAAAAPVAMTEAARALLAAVGKDDRTAVGAELAGTEKSGCGACHLPGPRRAR